MNASVILDYLISQSNGVTLHFHDKDCSLDLIKEVILRGFQIRNNNDRYCYGIGCGYIPTSDDSLNGSGISEGRNCLGYGWPGLDRNDGAGSRYCIGFGRGRGNGRGDGWSFEEGGLTLIGESEFWGTSTQNTYNLR